MNQWDICALVDRLNNNSNIPHIRYLEKCLQEHDMYNQRDYLNYENKDSLKSLASWLGKQKVLKFEGMMRYRYRKGERWDEFIRILNESV